MRHPLQYLSLFYVSCLFSSTEIILSPKSERRRAHMSWTRAGSSLSLASAKKHLFPCIGLGPGLSRQINWHLCNQQGSKSRSERGRCREIGGSLDLAPLPLPPRQTFFVLFPPPVCGGGGGAAPSIARLPLPLSLRGWFFLPAFHFQRERN